MNVNEKKEILRNSIDSKRIWESQKMREEFIDMAKAILNRYGSDFKIDVRIIVNKNGPIASTSFNKITLNAGCPQVQKIIGLNKQILYLKGLLAHELSHILYMDKIYYDNYKRAMDKGNMLPHFPDTDIAVTEKIKNCLKVRKNTLILKRIASEMINTIEDGYGENTYLTNFYGSLLEGMKFMRKEFYLDLKSARILEIEFQEQKEKQLYCIMSAMLSYALYGKVKDEDDSYEVIQVLDEIKPLIDRTMGENFKLRLNTVNEIIVKLWDYISPLFEKEDDEKEDKQNNSQEENSDDSQNNPSQEGTPDKKTSSGSDSENGENQTDEENSYEKTFGKPGMGHGGSALNPSSKQASKNFDENEEVPEEDISDLIDEVLTELAQESLEEENLQVMNQMANEGSYKGPIHIVRDIQVDDSMISDYDSYLEYLEVSRRMQKKLKQQIEDKQKGGKRTNLFVGRKVEARNIIHNDGRYFYNNKLPSNYPTIAVSYVIDESGSMSSTCSNGKTREENAKIAAIILEDFCRSLRFPIEIIGSTADHQFESGSAELTSYVSFNSVDKKDRYRLTKIESKSCCRDGAALSYAFDDIKKRPEDIKIIFMVSDGSPNAIDYGGATAIRELKNIQKDIQKNNILLFAAAVGDDKDKIQAIYGDSFLDITDMDMLPKIFIDKIKKFIQR